MGRGVCPILEVVAPSLTPESYNPKPQSRSELVSERDSGFLFSRSEQQNLLGGLNLYAYVGGNPLSYIDPLGLANMAPAIGESGHGNRTYDYRSGSSASLDAYTRIPSLIAGGAVGVASIIPAGRAVKMCYEAAKTVKDPCRNAVLAAALGAGICRGDPADDFVNDMKNREEIRRGSKLAGQKKIGNQRQYP